MMAMPRESFIQWSPHIIEGAFPCKLFNPKDEKVIVMSIYDISVLDGQKCFFLLPNERLAYRVLWWNSPWFIRRPRHSLPKASFSSWLP